MRIIVPFAPGGGNDFIARFMAQRLSASLGQPFLIGPKGTPRAAVDRLNAEVTLSRRSVARSSSGAAW